MQKTRQRIRDRLVPRRGLVHRNEQSKDRYEGAFAVCSFWEADFLALNGNLSEATEIFETALGYANDVYLLAEEIDPESGDALGNFPQAFTHLGTHIDSGRQPGHWDDADEYSLFTRHDFYAEPRQSEIHRLLFTLHKWLDCLADLRGCISRVTQIDMVARGRDRTSARKFCSHHGAACYLHCIHAWPMSNTARPSCVSSSRPGFSVYIMVFERRSQSWPHMQFLARFTRSNETNLADLYSCNHVRSRSLESWCEER
jgi:hypothetical protein